MSQIGEAFVEAWHLISGFDTNLVEIVGLSLRVSGGAVVAAGMLGLPLGAWLAVARFPLRRLLITLVSALMGLPPVVVGLVVYLLLSGAGPLGPLELLYTPSAMLVAQAALVLPIIAALTCQSIQDLHRDYQAQLDLFGLSMSQRLRTLLWEARHALITILLAGLGRALAEVGAVLIVGGNINHVTRVMTTTIALETSRGNLALALGLGIVLMALAILINALVMTLGGLGDQGYRR